MHGSVIVVEIGCIGLVVERLLNEVHALEILKIVGILHCLAILRIGKITQNHLPVPLGITVLPVPVVEQVHIIICVEAVGVVGVSL